MGRAFGPFDFVCHETWGVAPGWDGCGPLALNWACPSHHRNPPAAAGHEQAPTVRHYASLGQRPRSGGGAGAHSAVRGQNPARAGSALGAGKRGMNVWRDESGRWPWGNVWPCVLGRWPKLGWNGALPLMGRAVGARRVVAMPSWGVAPRWDVAGPLALGFAANRERIQNAIDAIGSVTPKAPTAHRRLIWNSTGLWSCIASQSGMAIPKAPKARCHPSLGQRPR